MYDAEAKSRTVLVPRGAEVALHVHAMHRNREDSLRIGSVLAWKVLTYQHSNRSSGLLGTGRRAVQACAVPATGGREEGDRVQQPAGQPDVLPGLWWGGRVGDEQGVLYGSVACSPHS